MGELHSVDLIVAVILAIALLRGIFLGLIREAFSIAALASACLAVRLFAGPLGDWLVSVSGGAIGSTPAPWLAGIGLAVASASGVGLAGRWLRRGAQAVGLGFADRLGGAALGAAEGALVAGVLLLVASWLLGADHRFLDGSRSIAALDVAQRFASERELDPIDVASPPRS